MHTYRSEIDGLRTIAVISVILYHLGYVANGYLGVDVFFVISGFLITKIINREIEEKRFSIVNFYLRRTRRIIPLVLFINIIALIIGLLVMLPNDLKDLAQSIFATNFFSNNILEYILTKDYWDVANEFKPLMHTWSLGVEEQFYIVYPLIFMIFGAKHLKYVLPIIIILSVLSLALYLTSTNEQAKFYLIQYRFFELALGGIGALLVKKQLWNISYSIFFVISLIVILLSSWGGFEELNLIIVLFSTLILLTTKIEHNKLSSFILKNKLMMGLGKISFSLYMWHQLVLAYSRYFIIEESSIYSSVLMFGVTLLLSITTYYIIEEPFRNKTKINTKILLIIVGTAFLITSSISLYLNSVNGVIRDVPEMGILKSEVKIDSEIVYNDRVYGLFQDKKTFDINNEKKRVLVIGNSFARDWINVLLESTYKNELDIVYVYAKLPYKKYFAEHDNINALWSEADYVFISIIDKIKLENIIEKYSLEESKAYVIGIKNFGLNNGLFYNKQKNSSYCNQFAKPREGYIEENIKYQKRFGKYYIDIMGMILNKDNEVPVFSNECKFISQDGVHLTESGAKYFAKIISNDSNFILN